VAKLDRLVPGWSSLHRLRPSWDQTLLRMVEFKNNTGRWPSAISEDRRERALAAWLYRQRSTTRHVSDREHAERIAKLDKALPHWRDHHPRRQDQRWNMRLNQLLDHTREHGRLPVLRASSSSEEYMLAKWLAVQRYAWKKGQLHPEREAKLDQLVPGWRRKEVSQATAVER
jgi:Helicase associated domain